MPMTKKSSPSGRLPVPVQLIERRIYLIRGQKVMIDSDLAELYQVETFNLNKAVKRNRERFPEDFMFQLTAPEAKSLRFQIGMSNEGGRGGRRYLPYAFTEQGVAMLSSVLNSDRAVRMSIVIVRAFVRLREVLASHEALNRKMQQLEATQNDHAGLFTIVFEDFQRLKQHVVGEIQKMKAPRRSKPRIGFFAVGK